jgi:hypothetical protein
MPDAAKDLVLQLVRLQTEARTCPCCQRRLTGCRLGLLAVAVDRLVVEVACALCSDAFTLTVTPSAGEGTVSIR